MKHKLIETGSRITSAVETWRNEHPIVTAMKKLSKGKISIKEFKKILIANAGSINNADNFGLTPLHHAIILGYGNKILEGNYKLLEVMVVVTKMLLIHGANPNATDIYGNTPLNFASWGIELFKFQDNQPSWERRVLIEDLKILSNEAIDNYAILMRSLIKVTDPNIANHSNMTPIYILKSIYVRDNYEDYENRFDYSDKINRVNYLKQVLFNLFIELIKVDANPNIKTNNLSFVNYNLPGIFAPCKVFSYSNSVTKRLVKEYKVVRLSAEDINMDNEDNNKKLFVTFEKDTLYLYSDLIKGGVTLTPSESISVQQIQELKIKLSIHSNLPECLDGLLSEQELNRIDEATSLKEEVMEVLLNYAFINGYVKYIYTKDFELISEAIKPYKDAQIMEALSPTDLTKPQILPTAIVKVIQGYVSTSVSGHGKNLSISF